jgi:broad specificity phosphatase PhoE
VEGRLVTAPTLLLVRHGESAWNLNNRYQGHGDSPLTDAGVAQADELAAWLEPQLEGDVRLVSSDLRRASATAAPLAKRLGADVHLDARFREVDVGTWSGRLITEVAVEHPDLIAASAAGADVARGGGETYALLRRRVEAVLAELTGGDTVGTTVVFTHGGPIRVAVAAALGVPAPGHDRVGEPAHCSMSHFELRAGRWRLVHYNRTVATPALGGLA